MRYRPPGTSVFVVNVHVGKGEASNSYKLDVQVSLLLPMSQAFHLGLARPTWAAWA